MKKSVFALLILLCLLPMVAHAQDEVLPTPTAYDETQETAEPTQEPSITPTLAPTPAPMPTPTPTPKPSDVQLTSIAPQVAKPGSSVGFTLTLRRAGTVTVSLLRADGKTMKLVTKALSAGNHTLTWKGQYDGGFAPHGQYTALATFVAGKDVSQSEGVKFSISKPKLSVDIDTLALTDPVTVINKGEKSPTTLFATASNTGRSMGHVYGSTVILHVQGTQANYTKVTAYNYKPGKRVTGFVPTKLLKTVTPNPRYAIIIDKSTQRLHVLRDGALYKTMLCSTGKNMNTPAGEYLTGAYMSYFMSHGLRANYAIRFNGGIYIHEVPNLNGNYAGYENKLGTKASNGCVRTPRGEAYWLYKNIPKSTRIIVTD